MRKLTNLVLTAAIAVTVAGAASADGRMDWNKMHSNSMNYAGAWYYPWVGPNWGPGGFQQPGHPFHGGAFTKTYVGEVTYADPTAIQLRADGSGDLITFFTYERETMYTPTQAAIHAGSKARITADDSHRARWVHVIPFYKWLRDRAK